MLTRNSGHAIYSVNLCKSKNICFSLPHRFVFVFETLDRCNQTHSCCINDKTEFRGLSTKQPPWNVRKHTRTC